MHQAIRPLIEIAPPGPVDAAALTLVSL